MRLTLSILLLFLMFALDADATPDSLKQKATWVITPRFNTLNMAPVSGNIVNRHVNVDVTLVYTKNKFSWMVANAVDLEDRHSDMNYFLTNVRYKLNVTGKLAVSPFLAFYSEHAHQVFDPVSDANGGMIFSFQHKAITVEAFVLFVRLTHAPAEKDLINRFEIRYKTGAIVLSGFVYQNTSYFDTRKRLAVGFKAILPELKLFNQVRTRTELTGSFKIIENPETQNLSGLFLSLAFPVGLKKVK
jgi:hypothetical protein